MLYFNRSKNILIDHFMVPFRMSATEAKVNFGTVLGKVKAGTPVIVQKNDQPEMVCISIEDYEDFLELKDQDFQKTLKNDKKAMDAGKFGGVDDLYALHRKTITREARQ